MKITYEYAYYATIEPRTPPDAIRAEAERAVSMLHPNLPHSFRCGNTGGLSRTYASNPMWIVTFTPEVN